MIDHILQEAQGWYSDGWVTTRSRFMLPAGNGNLRLRGSLPDLGPTLKGQTILVECNGKMREKRLNFGEFDMVLPFSASSGPANISIRATRSVVPAAQGLGADWRRLAFILHAPEWAR
jgi:hypothetical protein